MVCPWKQMHNYKLFYALKLDLFALVPGTLDFKTRFADSDHSMDQLLVIVCLFWHQRHYFILQDRFHHTHGVYLLRLETLCGGSCQLIKNILTFPLSLNVFPISPVSLNVGLLNQEGPKFMSEGRCEEPVRLGGKEGIQGKVFPDPVDKQFDEIKTLLVDCLVLEVQQKNILIEITQTAQGAVDAGPLQACLAEQAGGPALLPAEALEFEADGIVVVRKLAVFIELMRPRRNGSVNILVTDCADRV